MSGRVELARCRRAPSEGRYGIFSAPVPTARREGRRPMIQTFSRGGVMSPQRRAAAAASAARNAATDRRVRGRKGVSLRTTLRMVRPRRHRAPRARSSHASRATRSPRRPSPLRLLAMCRRRSGGERSAAKGASKMQNTGPGGPSSSPVAGRRARTAPRPDPPTARMHSRG